MIADSTERPGRRMLPPPGAPQSLSPFESRTTTLIVLWVTLLVSAPTLVICWALFS